jgi:hypothetical protein
MSSSSTHCKEQPELVRRREVAEVPFAEELIHEERDQPTRHEMIDLHLVARVSTVPAGAAYRASTALTSIAMSSDTSGLVSRESVASSPPGAMLLAVYQPPCC